MPQAEALRTFRHHTRSQGLHLGSILVINMRTQHEHHRRCRHIPDHVQPSTIPLHIIREAIVGIFAILIGRQIVGIVFPIGRPTNHHIVIRIHIDHIGELYLHAAFVRNDESVGCAYASPVSVVYIHIDRIIVILLMKASKHLDGIDIKIPAIRIQVTHADFLIGHDAHPVLIAPIIQSEPFRGHFRRIFPTQYH